jgi:hypothetical protein
MVRLVKIDVVPRFHRSREPKKGPSSGGTIFVYEDEKTDNGQKIKSLKMDGPGHRYFKNGFCGKR